MSPIGAGGMGEVYEARDTRLGRRVAVKVIRSDVASDPDRRKRFEREARAVAALSHPNICAVFDVGREASPRGPVDYLVVEYLDGMELSVRLQKGPLPTAELLKAGAEIAAALDSAHRAGIVHRDVKPSNIVLTRTGAKLLDFGLARLRSNPLTSDSDGSGVTETAHSAPLTDAGVVVGTYPYMAPEALEGKPVDARADLFALGAVLYEMATGRRAFQGSTPASLAAAILTGEPTPLTTLRPVAPFALERLVKNLLAKDPDARVQTAHDVALRLRDIEQDSSTVAGHAGRRFRPVALWSLAALVSVLTVVAAWMWLRPRAAPLPPERLVQLTTLRHPLWGPTFSPDGQQVAFCWMGERGDNWDIYIKMVDSPEVRRLTEGPEVDVKPRWSPDGKLIAFDQYPVWGPSGGARGRIRVVSPLGGASRKVGDLPPDGTLSWSPDGRWLATRRFREVGETRPEDGALYLVPLEGGEPRVLTRPEPPDDDFDPAFSPDGRRLAYSSCSAGTNRFSIGFSTCEIFVLDLDPGYAPSGSPRRVTRQDLDAHNPVWTLDGASIVYDATQAAPRLFRVDATGDRPPEPVEIAGFQSAGAAVAPTGNRLAFVRGHEDYDLYRFEPGRPAQPFLASSAYEMDPDYSPDGRRIAFSSTRGGGGWEVWLANADGTNPTQLTRGPGKWQASPAWSPDGRQIAFDSLGMDSQSDIWIVDPEGGAPSRATRDPGDERAPVWSRDGQWVYFTSGRSGAPEVWRVPAGGGVEERVTHGGASGAQVSVDGRSVLYWREKDGHGPLIALPLDGGPERTLVKCALGWTHSFRVHAAGLYYRSCGEDDKNPIRLLDPATGRSRLLGLMEGDHGARFAVSPDGKSILYSSYTSRSPDLMMIENFQ